MKLILRRAIALLPAIGLQALWLLITFKWLSGYAAVIELCLSVLAFLFVVYVITKKDEATYKLLWLLVILTFPIPGTVLYLWFGDKRTARPLQKKMEQARGTLPACWEEKSDALKELEKQAPRMAQTFGCIQKKTGFPVLENGEATYYPLGELAFADMLLAMKAAEHYIFIEYFILEEAGEMWRAMEAVLMEKAAQGVDIRVMYDDLGSIAVCSGDMIGRLKKQGIRCIAFNPMKAIKGTLNNRDHKKMLIVDGKTAFTGGINLADEYINRVCKYGHWKDIGIRIRGAGVRNYVYMFSAFWNAFSKEPIPQSCFTLSETEEPWKRDGYVLSYFDSPFYRDAVSNNLYMELLSQATAYAWFYTPYLMLGDGLLDSFARAAQRGVDVRIIMPGIPDKKLVFRLSRSYYRRLLEAGVQIYEYTPGFVHAKGCVIDDRVGTVGTVNLDYRSLFLHFENNSLFYDAGMLLELKKDYLETVGQCRRITLQMVKRGFWKDFVDSILKIFAPLL